VTEGKGRVLAAMVGMVDDILGAALLDCHLQSLSVTVVKGSKNAT
jgi:hypothetical protein